MPGLIILTAETDQTLQVKESVSRGRPANRDLSSALLVILRLIYERWFGAVQHD